MYTCVYMYICIGVYNIYTYKYMCIYVYIYNIGILYIHNGI